MTDDEEIAVAMLRLPQPVDVSRARAQRLRERCHHELRKRTAPQPVGEGGQVWRRTIGPALIGAWSAVYLFETLRAAATVYGF